MSSDLVFVTQVAPYSDGPAGVHGVLDQAAVALEQVAELADSRLDASPAFVRRASGAI